MSTSSSWSRGTDWAGGRILTSDEAGRASEDGFDLGAPWVWPEVQPAVAVLVKEPGLSLMPQHGEGHVIFHPTSREAPQRFRRAADAPANPSMRLVGGTGALVSALARDLPRDRIRLGAQATSLALGAREVRLTVERADGSTDEVIAEQVIAALPWRLREAAVSSDPPLDEADAQRWRCRRPGWRRMPSSSLSMTVPSCARRVCPAPPKAWWAPSGDPRRDRRRRCPSPAELPGVGPGSVGYDGEGRFGCRLS